VGFQHLGHLLVHLLPCTLQQGGIRRVLHQGMLEDIGNPSCSLQDS
jgi:hypothetical protein